MHVELLNPCRSSSKKAVTMATRFPSSPQECCSEPVTESPPNSSSQETEPEPSDSPETSSSTPSAPLLPELKALQDPAELSLTNGLPDYATVLRYCRLLRKENKPGKMSDFALAKKAAEDLVVLWASVASQFSGTRLMELHNIQNKVKNIMARYKFAFNETGTRISAKQQTTLARDAPKLFDIRSCR